MYRNHRVICDQDYSWGRRRIQAVIHRTPDRPDDGLNVQRLNFLMRVLYTSINYRSYGPARRAASRASCCTQRWTLCVIN